MKTIHQTELINKIFQDPMAFIGQRSFKLFKAYLLPFDLFSKYEIPITDEPILNKYPSIEEEVESTYGLVLGSRHWSSPLKYYCEDERAHFEIALKFILDYDKKYPNPQEVNYILKLKSQEENFDLLKYMGVMGYRPEMYFGTSELACLRAFIDGYFFFKQFFGIELSVFEKKLLQFMEQFKIEGNRDFKTWDRNYRWHWDFSVYGSNERHAIPYFLKEIEDLTGHELLIHINDKEIKVDWSNYQSWNKSAHELYELPKIRIKFYHESDLN